MTHYLSFPVLTLSEVNEPPAYFTRDARQGFQMNWFELRNYIGKLRGAGFDVARMSVQLQKKLAFPLMIATDHHDPGDSILHSGGD